MSNAVIDQSVRSRVLDAAEEIAVRDGVSNLTLETVAREAGVSKGGLLYHFPSKNALIHAMVERHAERCEASQASNSDGDDTPGAYTRAYLDTRSAKLNQDNKPLQAAIVAAAASDPQYLEPIRKRCHEWQQRLLNDGIDPADAMVARLAIDGLCLGKLFGMPIPDGELRDQVLMRLRAMTVLRSESSKNHSEG